MRILREKLVDRTFAKFVLVGAANTVFGTAVMFAAYNVLGLGYWPSTAANYVLGSVLSFFLNRSFTFRSKAKVSSSARRFVANIAVCWLAAYGVAKPLARWALSSAGPWLQDNVAMATGMCLFVAMNYVGQRYYVFKKD